MIIGTAGHVDHGKTSLVRALTGVDTDRLAEEKRRGISIELGFAYLPAGEGVLGFVDVPGHERLVHTMLAGAAGIDLALLVVAATDGPMPQTAEHLQILELLGIPALLVALTKTDLVEPPALAAAEAATRALLAGTRYAGADVLPVSVRSGEGLEALRRRLQALPARPAARRDAGAFRFAVDRSFVLPGTGVVATGTVLSGRIAAGDAVTLLPRGLPARVRALHVQNRPAAAGQAGERCALNLAGPGVERDTVARGDWLLHPDCAATTSRLDVELALLPSEPHGLRQGAELLLHLGASRVPVRVVRLEAGPLGPGGHGLAQLVLGSPLPAHCDDRFVLREPGARRTVGGGRVLDARPPARHRRSPARLAVLDTLRALPEGTPPAAVLAALLAQPPGIVALDALCADRGLDAAQAQALAADPELVVLEADGQAHAVGRAAWAALRERVAAALGAHHAENPDLPGPVVAELRRQAAPDWPAPLHAAALRRLAQDGAVALQPPWVRLPGHAPRLSDAEARLWEGVRTLLAAERFRPPRVRDLAQALGAPEPAMRQLCKRMTRQGELSELAPDHFFLRPTVAEMADVAATLSTDGPFTAAQFRDRLDNGRKVAIQILEFFDRRGLTVRHDDLRRVVRVPAELFGGG